MKIDAYDIVRGISSCDSNVTRGEYLHDVLCSVAGELDRFVEVEEIPGNILDAKHGDKNYILRTGEASPFLLVAHYDAYVYNWGIVPGANDNGSGVGVCLQSLSCLKDLPVDVAFFAGEEKDLTGSSYYCMDIKGTDFEPRMTLCLDCCGVGDVVYSPRLAKTRLSRYDINGEFRREVLRSLDGLGYKFSAIAPNRISDHLSFLKHGMNAGFLSSYRFRDPFYWAAHSVADSFDKVSKGTLNMMVNVVGTSVRSYCEKGLDSRGKVPVDLY